MDTFRLCSAIKDAIGAKRFAVAVGRTQQTVYDWCRDPQDPEAQGSTNLLDWFEAVVVLLGSRPEWRPVLVQLRAWVVGVIDRALGAWQPQPLTRDTLAVKTSAALREFSEFVGECAPAGFDRERLAKEGAEAIAEIERLMRAAERGLEEETNAGRSPRLAS